MPRARPDGTVTFLSTDIEDSTRRWDGDPAAIGLVFASVEER